MHSLDDAGFRRHLAGALAAAALVRLAALALPVDPFVNPDAFAFRDLAHSLATTGRLAYEDQGAPGLTLRAFRSLLYPMFLAPFAKGGFGLALLLQGVLGLPVVAGIALLARRGWNNATGALAAWIGAFYWTSVYYERQITSEALFTPLLVAGALAALHARRPAWAFVSGLCLGLAALTRPAGLVVAVVLAALWILGHLLEVGRRSPLARGSAQPGASGIAAFALALTLVLVPALSRNRAVVGRPVLLTSGGMNFWIGNGRGVVGEAWSVMKRDLGTRGEVGMDQWFYDDTWAHRGDVARGLPALLLAKVRTFASPFARDFWYVPWRFLWPLALAGLVLAWPGDSAARAVFVAVLASQAALALITVPWARYRYPMEPFLWPFAAAAALTLWRRGPLGRAVLGVLVAGNLALLLLQVLR